MTEPEQSLVAEQRNQRVRAMFSWRMAREVALTVGAIAGVLCLLSAVAAIAFGIKPVVFRSGSMAPAIDTGALALSRTVDAADLKVGDVVTVKTGTGVRVTHRVHDISIAGGKATMVLKGDANGAVDDRAYVVTSAPRVLFDIPKLGYVVSFTSGPVGIFAGGLMVGLVLLTIFRPATPAPASGRAPTPIPPSAPRASTPTLTKPARTRTPRSSVAATRRATVVLASTLAVSAAVAGTFTGSETQAYYSDSATATSGAFSRSNPSPPSAPAFTNCVTTGGNGLTLNWAAATDPTSFEIRYSSSPSKPPESVAGSLRQKEVDANLNNTSGEIWMVAINANGTSPDSTHYAFSGNGSHRTCTPVN